ncbi:MAG: glycerol-3-phosphate 1-O-acyltransferase PlsY [Flavobacteriales bacterium]|jgi:glycerol-3-phosphate acyltransferase PlsY|nr:glycerol-3-phosphate 1-O-acyltransferase PlsY [Flavobacteriales bacterium]MCI1753107.1 glycerol-3-phosphate 1-O-acyltransferase PlsY [Flavobacteriales bacterium]
MEFPWIYGLTAMVIGYLCGSVPTAVWWGKAFYGMDVRDHGSKNAGATNTFRVLGPKAGVPVLLIDVLKGFLPVRLLPLWSGSEPYSDAWNLLRVLLVLAAVVGHLYPVFAGFRGGKGIATSLGGVLAVHPGSAFACIIVFFIIWFATRYVSFASLCAALTFPLAVAFLFQEKSEVLIIFSIALCALVFFTHRQNISRLLKGTENRMAPFGRSTPRE